VTKYKAIIFDLVVSCDELGTDKNSSRIFDYCVENMKLGKRDVLIVEDAYHAINTAKKAGYDVAGVYDLAFSAYENEIKETSDYYFESLNEMEQIL